MIVRVVYVFFNIIKAMIRGVEPVWMPWRKKKYPVPAEIEPRASRL
jgi:hypothetical protein